VAITYHNQYGLQPGTTSLTMVPPASTAAGDMVILYVTNKLSGVTPATPTNFTLIGSGVVGTGADGAGVGQLRLTAWYRILPGAASNSTITITGGNSASGGGMVYRKGGSDTWAAPTVLFGSDTSSGTGFSASMSAQAGYAVGNWLLSVGTTSANTSLSARGITLPGCTVTYTGINSGGTNNGNDCFLWTDHEVVTAGAQSGVGVTTGTTAASTTGGAAQVRVALATSVTGAAGGTFGFTATAAGVDRALGLAAGAFGFTATASGDASTPGTAPTVAGVESGAGTSNFTVAVPAGTTDGELLIGVVASDWNTLANNTLPLASWTALPTSDYDGGTNQVHVGLFYRVASSEPANYTVTIGGGADTVGAILRVTDADPTPVIAEVAPNTFTAGAGATTAPSVAPNGANDLLLTFHVSDGASGGGTLTWTPPSGMTDHVDRQSTTWTSLQVSSLQSPSNPSGTKTATPSGAHDKGAACTISIKSSGAGVPTVNGVATGAFGFTSAASGVARALGAAIASLGFTATAAGVDRAIGAAGAPLGFTAAASGLPRTLGAASTVFGFTATALGVDRAIGLASATLGFTGTAAGIDRALGAAAAPLGFTATASGRVSRRGAATASFGYTATASGTSTDVPPVAGQAVAAFGFSATAAGVPRTGGAAAATFGFTGTASGVDRAVGVAVAAFGFTAATSGRPRSIGAAVAAFGFVATTSGTPRVRGAAVAPFGFTAAVLGFPGTPPTTGAALALFGFTATAQGQPRTPGATSAAFGFTATANGRPRVVAVAVATFGFTGTSSGRRSVLGLGQVSFAFVAVAAGDNGGPTPEITVTTFTEGGPSSVVLDGRASTRVEPNTFSTLVEP
jgi:hypothetical protein